MTTYTVYGTFYGTDELPDVVAVVDTYAEATALIASIPDSDPVVEYDFYLIEMTVGGVSFASAA
jgi:hypothetical protein